MKLVTYLDGHPRVGAVLEEGVADLSERFDSMQTLIEGGEPALEEARSLVAKVDTVDDAELQAPIPHPRRNVFCMGWNYLTHFEEGRAGAETSRWSCPSTQPSSTNRRRR